MNSPFVWNNMYTEERLKILRILEIRQKIKARSRHKLVYGTHDEIPKSLVDAVYMIDWEAALGRKTTS